MTRRAADAAALCALSVVLTLAIAAPTLHAPSERVFGMELVGRHHDPFTAMEHFRQPVALGVYLQPLTDLPGAALTRVLGPVAAYNALVLLTFPLAAAAAYALARKLQMGSAGAAFAALAFAFSPFHIAHAAYHPHIAQTQWVPLYFLALWRSLDDATPAGAGLLAAAVAGVALSNFYGGLIAAVVTPVAVAAYWRFRSRGSPGSVRSLAMTSGWLVAAAGAGLAYAHYAARDLVVNPAAYAFAREDLFRYSAKWWAYMMPAAANPLWGGVAQRAWGAAGVREGLLEQQVSLGWGVLALGLVAVFGWMRGQRDAAPSAAVPVLASVAGAALLCSLSPERTIGTLTFTRPSAFLYELVPMFRSYARFGVVVQLMAALLAGIGAAALWRAGNRAARIACVSLVLLTAGEYAVWPPAMWRDPLPTPAHRWLARQAGRVQAVDCAPLTASSESVGWLSGFRIARRPPGFEDCTEPSLAYKLSGLGYTHLIVRRRTPEGRWFDTEGGREGLERAGHFDEADVFIVTAAAPLAYTTGMTGFYPREYDSAWTWRWMGAAASWEVVNRSGRSIVASADVELEAFHGARLLTLLLDGHEVQRLTIQGSRGVHRIGPYILSPGAHELAFHPEEPPSVARDVLNNGDPRPLSFALGTWHWEGARR